MGDIGKTILKTALTGLGVLVLVALTIVFAGMSRQALLFLIVFILMAVLGIYVRYLMQRVEELEKVVDKLLREKETADQ